jgi:adenine-specific DNA-methyltransferase
MSIPSIPPSLSSIEQIKKYKYEMGQYFTTNIYLKECIYGLIHNINNTNNIILEPSIGQGDLVDYVLNKNKQIKFHLYEIDDKIELLQSINKDNVIYCDFLKTVIAYKYATIIGNPPFVKTKTGHRNLYLDFIDKCYELLDNNGELIFIVPSDFIKLTSSAKIINKLMNNGTITHIIKPNNESLFINATIDIMIFRYCKNTNLSNEILVNNEKKYLINTNGILTFTDTDTSLTNASIFADYFDIYVGIVSGKDAVYKNSNYGNINVLNGKNKIEKYILIKDFPTADAQLNEYMVSHKPALISRKIKKFNEKNWFEWGALRNYETIKKNIGRECIYIRNISRLEEICFKGNVQHFGGGLIIMIPKIIPNKTLNITKIVEFINSSEFKSNYMYSGRFKIGHKQVCNVLFNVPSYI